MRAPSVGEGDGVALDRYVRLVETWRGSVDLVGRGVAQGTLAELVRESLVGLNHLPTEGHILDVGSGVGVPAIPILVCRPGLVGTLLEPRERRWAFLREVVRELGCNARVLRERLEHHDGSGYDAVLVRGVAREVWWDGAASRVRTGGGVLWWTSVEQAGRAEAELGRERVVTSALPGPGGGRLVVWRQCST